jgi:hypothetical protein
MGFASVQRLAPNLAALRLASFTTESMCAEIAVEITALSGSALAGDGDREASVAPFGT